MIKRYFKNGAVLSLLSSMLFATQFPLIKLGLGHIPAQYGAILECLFTGLLCLISARLLGHSVRVIFNKELVISGLLNAAGLIFLFEGLARVHPGILGLIGRLYFVYAMLISYLYFQEQPNRLEMFLIALAILGVFLVSFQMGQTGSTSIGSALGIIFAFLYPALFAIQNAVIKPIVKRFDTSTVLLNTKAYALIPLLIYGVLRNTSGESSFSLTGVGIIFCSTFLSTFLGLLLFYKALAIATFRLANLMKAAEPVFVLLFSCVLFPVALTPQNVIGTLLILASVGFVAFTQHLQVAEQRR
ncbi:DMT family transporter [bacterium]|nr:DMT family transporter [bacterium]